MKRLEHLFCEERLRKLGLLSLEKQWFKKPRQWGNLLTYTNTSGEGAKATEPGSFQWSPVTGQEATGTN